MNYKLLALSLIVLGDAASSQAEEIGIRTAPIHYMLDDAGHVTSCKVTTSTGSERLDREICDTFSKRAYVSLRPINGIPSPGREGDMIFRWPTDRSPSKSVLQPERLDIALAEPPEVPWITAADFPSRAAIAHIGGKTTIRWDVLPSGRTYNCQVVHGSGSAELDQRACTVILTRGVYPIGPNGLPKVSSGSVVLDWHLQ